MVDNGNYIIEKRMSSKEFYTYIKKLKDNSIVIKRRDYGGVKKYIAYIHTVDSSTLERKEKYSEPCIELKLKYNKGFVKIRIKNSLRKWYFGKRSMADFNKSKYIDCLYKMSSKIHLTMQELLTAKITKIEIGVNLKLSPEFLNYLLTLVGHDRLKFRDIYGNQTVSFRGTNLSLIFYDKLAELRNNNLITSNVFSKLSNKFFFLRIEVRIKKVSGVAFSKEKISTINDLLVNWEECFNYLNNHFNKVLQVDFISPKIALELQKGKDSLIYDLIKFNGIERMSTASIITIINTYTNRPSIHRKKIAEISHKFRALKNPSFKRIIKQKLLEKSPVIFS